MSTHSPSRLSWLLRHERWSNVAISLAIPLALFLVLEPDRYYIQNGLDPFFYTGYVQNFQNIFWIAGEHHYFISRWTIYLPQRVLLEILGNPKTAYLIFRWLGAAAIAWAILELGRTRWRRLDSAMIACLVLAMPMTVRSVLTDYSDAVVLPCGVVLILLVATRPTNRFALIGAGMALGAMVVANPFAATIGVAAAVVWLRQLPWRRGVSMLGLAGAGFVAVLLAGLIIFRIRYGVDNVYSPTIDYMRDFGSRPDPLKSPRLWWLGYRLWIYTPALVIASYHVLRRRFSVEFTEAERSIIAILTIQFGIQIWYQFSRHGNTLEITYYWVYVLPAFALGFAVVTAALARLCGARPLVFLTVGVIGGLRLVGAPAPEIFQSWIDALLVVVALGYFLRNAVRTRSKLTLTSFTLVVLLLQCSSPRPEPIVLGEQRVLASYESVYDDERSAGEASFDAATWFVDQMERLPTPVARGAVFWWDDAIGARLAAMFGAQVTDRWVNIEVDAPVDGPLSVNFANAIRAKGVEVFVLIGADQHVRDVSGRYLAVATDAGIALDEPVPSWPGLTVIVVTSLPLTDP